MWGKSREVVRDVQTAHGQVLDPGSHAPREAGPPEVRRRGFVVLYTLVLAFLTICFSDLIAGGVMVLPLPLLLLVLVPVEPIFYGLGMLLIRETTLRWGKGWAATVLLGGALGVVAEGLFTKVIFGPASEPAIGVLGTFGRWAGVNWVLAGLAFLFHGVVTTAVPLFLMARIFPHTSERRLLSSTAYLTTAILFVVALSLFYVYIPYAGDPELPIRAWAYSPSFPAVALVGAVVVACSYAAWKLPPDFPSPPRKVPGVGLLPVFAAGAVFTGGLFLIGGPLVSISGSPAVVLGAMVVLGGGELLLVRRWLARGSNRRWLGAMVAGVILPYLLVDSMLEFQGDLGALPLGLLLFAFALHVARTEPREVSPAS